MEQNTIEIAYFSPTRGSEKIAKAVASGIGLERRKVVDLTTDFSADVREVSSEHVAVIAAPVYAGRVAPTAVQRLKRLKGGGTLAVVVVVYGNRDYEDALVELYDLAVAAGFVPVAAGAFVGEHSYSRKQTPVAAGRPDAEDLAAAKAFGAECRRKIESGNCCGMLDIPGSRPYRDVPVSVPQAPVSTESCFGCGECVPVCPTAAIRLEDGRIATDAALCIKCCACVKMCPNEARVFDSPFAAILHAKFSERRNPETFM